MKKNKSKSPQPLNVVAADETLLLENLLLDAAPVIQPDNSLAVELFNQANALFRSEKWQEAAQGFETAFATNPGLAPAALQRARCAVNLDDLLLAREWFAIVLRLEPENFSAWLEVGHLCRNLGVFDQALAAYQRSIAVAPERFEGYLGLLRLQEDLGRMEAAALVYRQCGLAVSADQRSMVHHRVARYRLERSDLPRALESLQQAVWALQAESRFDDVNARAELLMDEASVLMRLGDSEAARLVFQETFQATSEATLTRLSENLYLHNLSAEALQVLQRNVELHPESALAHWKLAYLAVNCWNLDLALAHLDSAEALAPQSGALQLRASIAGKRGDQDQAFRAFRGLAEAEGPNSKLRSSTAMTALYCDSLSAAEVAEVHQQLFAPMGLGARSAQSFKVTLTSGRKIKLGLVTADFHHQHPVNIFMQPLLARFDPAVLEISVYFTGHSHDDQTGLAKSRVQYWHEVQHFSDAKLARMIEADGIEVLMDLAGHTGDHRMGLFAQRAAPVQVTFLGYPGSTGVPNMDWILADQVVAPFGDEALFSERVWRLPNTVFCFAPEADYPYPDFTDAVAERPLRFGSFNNVAKLTQHTIRLWAAILQQLPEAILVLKGPAFVDAMATQSFVERFAAEGVLAKQLAFRGPVGLTDMMAEYADIDIGLDPLPYNGGTTTLQAMWMGVPVVVKAGNNFVSRMGASFMQAAGLPEWVASDDEAYVRIAVQMAQDRQALLALKQGLRARLQALPAWDIDQYTRDFQAAIVGVWDDFVSASQQEGG